MNDLELKAYFAAVGVDLKVFLLQSFTTLYPGKEFLDSWHVDAIVYHLEQCIHGEMQRLILNMPPRHLKSFIASVVLPAYLLGRDPSAKIICISYSDDLARMMARDFRRIVESVWYQKVFPQVRVQKSTETEFVTDLGGYRYATSVGGTLTGRGGDFIIIDDPIKPEDTLSDKVRQATNEWYKSTLLSRLDDKQRSVLILVMQRLHVNDLTGFVENSGGFRKLALPAIASVDEFVQIGPEETYFREAGTALHEEREGVETLNKMRGEIGAFNFAAQYQQRPELPDGNMIKRKWLNIIPAAPQFNRNGLLIVSIDAAASTSDTADYTAITLIYSYDGQHYVVEAERGRWDYETLKKKAEAYVKRFGKEITFIVENASVGTSLIYYLRKNQVRCFHNNPRDEKVVRVARILPVLQEKRLHIVSRSGQNDWVEPLISELVNFPNGRFDDQVDSITQAVGWAEPMVNSQSTVTLC